MSDPCVVDGDETEAYGDQEHMPSPAPSPAADSLATCDYADTRGDYCADFPGDTGPAYPSVEAAFTTQSFTTQPRELPYTGPNFELLPLGTLLICIGVALVRKGGRS